MNDLLKQIAPAIATALGGPLAGAAASFLASKLGVSEGTVESVTDAINSQKMTSDQIAQIKVAEIEFNKFLEQNKIDLERIDAGDRDSARKMQISTGSWVPGVLSILIIVGFFGILIGMLYGHLKVTDQQSLLILLGSLSAGFGAVLNYYFGSSHGSLVKSELLAKK